MRVQSPVVTSFKTKTSFFESGDERDSWEVDAHKVPARTMLDLEVIPERALGARQWEFVLGEYPRTRLGELATLVQIRSHLFVLSRYATGPGGGNTQETVRHYQECSAEIQWTGLLDMSFGSRVNQLLLSQFVLHCISTLLTWMWWLTWQKMVSGCCLTPRTKDSRYWIISAWFHMPATCVEPHPDDRSLWCEESKVEILVSWHSVLWVLPILWNWYGWFMSEVTISLMPITITIATATSVRKKSYQP